MLRRKGVDPEYLKTLPPDDVVAIVHEATGIFDPAGPVMASPDGYAAPLAYAGPFGYGIPPAGQDTGGRDAYAGPVPSWFSAAGYDASYEADDVPAWPLGPQKKLQTAEWYEQKVKCDRPPIYVHT